MPTVRCVFLAVLLATPAPAVTAACAAIDHDHSAWSTILRASVSNGRVAYASLLREGRSSLTRYLGELSAACAENYQGWSREQRLAFWINTYNAFTLELILDHYPIASIRKIGWLPGAAFRREFIPMPGLKGGLVSLDDIEHGTLRADFQEPRIHFALVCAARGCPPLRDEAYRAADLDRQLDEQARTFLREASKNRFDPATRTLHLSPIFDWFRPDFELAAATLPEYVARYMDHSGVIPPDVTIEFTEYDWSLNQQETIP
jgi:hypothetical protein